MPGISRRTLLKQTSAGAAALGALFAAPRVIGSEPHAVASSPAAGGSAAVAAAAGTSLRGSSEPVVAYIRDSASGEIAIFSGTREIVLHDAALVSRLLQAGA
jgi:hypothetical protein